MPYFRAKKRCQYGGKVYEKNAVAEFFESVSSQSWDAMDDEAEELLFYPERLGPEQTGPEVGKQNESGKPEVDELMVSGEDFAELQGLYDAGLADLETQGAELKELKVKLEEAEDDLAALLVENEKLAKAAEDATVQQVSIADLKQKVADNENKSVLEEAIQKL